MNKSTIIITKVHAKDAQELLKFGRQTFYNSFGPPINTEKNIQSYLTKKFTLQQITQEILNPNSIFYFALVEDQIAGYLKLNFKGAQTEKVAGETVEIERIYVSKKFQGQKIGKLLLEKAIEIASQRNIDYIWLGVWDENIKAIKFYEHQGFITFDKHPFMLGTDLQTDIMMKLIL